MHLTDHGVHETWSSEKLDLKDLRPALELPRRDLSPSRFSEGAFESFVMNDSQANFKHVTTERWGAALCTNCRTTA